MGQLHGVFAQINALKHTTGQPCIPSFNPICTECGKSISQPSVYCIHSKVINKLLCTVSTVLVHAAKLHITEKIL